MFLKNFPSLMLSAAFSIFCFSTAFAKPVSKWIAHTGGDIISLVDCRNCEEDQLVVIYCSPVNRNATVSLPGMALRKNRPAGRVSVSIRVGNSYRKNLRATLDEQGLVGHVPQFEISLEDELLTAMAAGSTMRVSIAGERTNISLRGSSAAISSFKTACYERNNSTGSKLAAARKVISKCVNRRVVLRRDRSICIGRFADRCLKRRSTRSTLDQVACSDAELAAWDGMLNDNYAALLANLDGEAKKEPLRAAQRAWLDFRDKYCQLAHAFHDGGSIAQPMASYCKMKKTALQALSIRAWRKEFSGN